MQTLLPFLEEKAALGAAGPGLQSPCEGLGGGCGRLFEALHFWQQNSKGALRESPVERQSLRQSVWHTERWEKAGLQPWQ